MRVLWVCNIMLPKVAEHFHRESSSREGWLTGLSEQVLSRPEGKDITLGICFPTLDEELLDAGKAEIVLDDGRILFAYPIKEDVHRAEVYDSKLEDRFAEIIQDFRPDLVHCFGTEFPHTLAVTRAFHRPERTLIGIQGLCAVYANAYRANLPQRVWNRTTFRDLIKNDNLQKQREKYRKRGIHEMEAIRQVGHITGRTVWDQCYTQEWNEKAEYHFMNETLRPIFYDGEWSYDKCEKSSIFVSQGDYPIKGLHYLLMAMPEILEKHPEAKVYVAGNSIVKTSLNKGMDGLKGRIKLGSYGKYIYEIIKKNGLKDRVVFVGNQSAEEMKKQYLRANVFLCPSAMENSPNSLGEAMLLGMPIVSAKVGGIPTIFKDRADGLLYECDDIVSLAGCVNFMLDGGDVVDKMRKHARTHARETHDGEKNFRRLIEIYQSIVK